MSVCGVVWCGQYTHIGLLNLCYKIIYAMLFYATLNLLTRMVVVVGAYL
jgi:hypothetical protein